MAESASYAADWAVTRYLAGCGLQFHPNGKTGGWYGGVSVPARLVPLARRGVAEQGQGKFRCPLPGRESESPGPPSGKREAITGRNHEGFLKMPVVWVMRAT